MNVKNTIRYRNSLERLQTLISGEAPEKAIASEALYLAKCVYGKSNLIKKFADDYLEIKIQSVVDSIDESKYIEKTSLNESDLEAIVSCLRETISSIVNSELDRRIKSEKSSNDKHCGGPGLSDSGGERIKYPPGGLSDESKEVYRAVEAAGI